MAPLKAKTDEERWEELLNMSSYELYDYLYELGDEDHGLACESSALLILKYIVKHHNEELEGFLEEFIEVHGDDDYSMMNIDEEGEED